MSGGPKSTVTVRGTLTFTPAEEKPPKKPPEKPKA